MKDVLSLGLGFFVIALVSAQSNLTLRNFRSQFAGCKWDSPDFDKCVKEALNNCRIFFKRGVPELNIPPFDPFFAKEIVQNRGGANISYKLVLRNVSERGWTDSVITKFKSDRRKRRVQYTQYFPEKWLEGDYEFRGKVMNSNVDNKGHWNMTLYNYIQTTTLTRRTDTGPIKVRIEVDTIGDMDLHVGNLLRGRQFMENMLDRVINATWRPGFAVIRPLINDIVSTAFTEIFNTSLGHLELSNIITS